MLGGREVGRDSRRRERWKARERGEAKEGYWEVPRAVSSTSTARLSASEVFDGCEVRRRRERETEGVQGEPKKLRSFRYWPSRIRAAWGDARFETSSKVDEAWKRMGKKAETGDDDEETTRETMRYE
jgi:hypothetical protein